MTQISAAGRAIAEQIVSSADNFAAGLASSISRQGSGNWGPGPLWDKAILSMRTQAGGLAQNLEFLKLLGDDVLAQLTPDLRSQLDSQLKGVKRVLDEIHTDQGGNFATKLQGFRAYGDDVATQIKEILRKADEAQATSARTAVEGAEVLNWSLGDDVARETVRVTEEAAGNVQTRAAGGR
jgi:hypothetical protein